MRLTLVFKIFFTAKSFIPSSGDDGGGGIIVYGITFVRGFCFLFLCDTTGGTSVDFFLDLDLTTS